MRWDRAALGSPFNLELSVKMKSKSTLCCAIAALGFASLAALAIDGISAVKARPVASTPRLAIVALSEQRVSIYDATGKILEAPVSTGAIGYEPPAGIYSIVQKERVHHSNLYDDASMPFMQRITWTGMALHAGVLPGYAASHGCVRMPHAFAEQLYQLTELGLRVIVVREDIVPADFAQPALFSSPGGAKLTINLFNRLSEASLREQLQSIAAVKTAEAEAAMKREKEARMAAAKKAAEAAPAAQALRVAEANLAKAEADLKAAERAPQTAGSRVQIAKVEAAKKQARIKFEAAQAQLKATKLQAQPKLEAASQAETDAKAADATMIGAVKGAEIAKQLREQLQSIAAVKTAEAEAAISREKEARMAAPKKAAEAAPAAQALRVAEANLAKAEADLKAAERAPETADSRVQNAKVEAAKKQART